MVNLVIVSHSARLGEGVGELARQMLINDGCKLAIAAGIDDPDSPIGTDPLKVMEAIESVADTDHVLVMMDIGSALLSAETALDLLDPAIAAKVRLCAASASGPRASRRSLSLRRTCNSAIWLRLSGLTHFPFFSSSRSALKPASAATSFDAGRTCRPL